LEREKATALAARESKGEDFSEPTKIEQE